MNTHADNPDFSIVIPVWREEAIIVSTIAHVHALDPGGRCEVIVVDGDPSGSTRRAIHDDGVVVLTSEKGRGVQLNAGAAAARGGILVFLHADTRLPEGALDEIDAALRDPGVVGGAFALRFDSTRRVYRFMSWVVTRMTRLNRRPYGDQAIFLRKNELEKLGGFAPVPIMEDVDLVGRIRRAGGRMRMLDTPVLTSCRRMDAEGIVRRVATNLVMTALFRLGVSPQRLSRWYTDAHRVDGVVVARPTDTP